MRIVVLTNLLGICAALVGLLSFDLGWFAAAAIWFVSGPTGAVLAMAAVLAQQPAPDQMPVDVAAQSRVA